MTDRQTTRPGLTEEQKATVKVVEKDANLVELEAEELEQRIAPVRFT